MKFCSNCAHPVSFSAVEGEHIPRFHCVRCNVIHYVNPKVIVGCLPIWEDKVMLCKRGIEPQYGLWNIPGGFMENDETTEEGAVREMYEETLGRVRVIGLHTVFNVVVVNQVHLHYLVEMVDLDYSLTPESIDIQLFTEAEIPWQDVAFASSKFALKKYFEDRKNNTRNTHIGSLLEKDGKWAIRNG
jgi:ADP-ribose pyrophosphatase YjhB (NUDIX family)